MAIKGGTLPPSTPGPFSPGDPSYPSPENSRANEAAQLAKMANSETAKAVAYYEAQMESWNYSKRYVGIVVWAKPQVPKKRIVQDGQVVLGSEPACEEIPEYAPPAANPPGTAKVGPAIAPGWFSVAAGDTVAAGVKVKHPELPLTLQKVPSNMGLGWYQVVAQ